MPGAHVMVALRDGARRGQHTILAVCVMRVAAGVIVQPDAEVLDVQQGLLKHLLAVCNLPPTTSS